MRGALRPPRLLPPLAGERIIATMMRLALVATLLVCLPTSALTAQDQFQLDDGHWQQVERYAPDSPEGELQAARKALVQGHPKTATKLAEAWISQYPNHPMLAEAHLVRGDALVARQKYFNALYDYEYVIRTYPASPQFHTALQREFEIARLYTQGLNRKFLGMRLLPADGEGEELLIRIQERAPGSQLGEQASLTLSDYYFDKGEMELAAEAYELFLQNYPESDHREWSMLRLIQASLARFKGPPFDPTGLIEAAQRLRMYREEYPAAAEKLGADALLVRIDESLALGSLDAARWYELRHEPVSAAYIYQRVIADHPQTSAAQEAARRLDALDVTVAALPGNDQ